MVPKHGNGGRMRKCPAAVAALVVLTGVLMLTACDPTTVAPAAPHETGPVSATPVVAREALSLVDEAARTEAADSAERVIATGPARPTLIDNHGHSQTMVIRDESDMAIPSGEMQLTVYCSGEGTIVAAMTVDDETSLGRQLPCADSGTASEVTKLVRQDVGHKLTVTVMPIGETIAGVAYVVTRR